MDPLTSPQPTAAPIKSNLFTSVTPFSKTLAGIIFVALPFVGFYLGYTYAPPEVVTVAESTTAPMATSTKQTKRSFLGGEIPVSWSNYDMGDINILDTWPPTGGKYMNVVHSIAADEIVFGDWNAEQIDILYLNEQGKNAFVANARDPQQSEVTISEKSFDGVPVTIIMWPLDNGQVTKGGTGGSSYLFQASETGGNPLFILIDKQALGDPAFEQAFAHYLDTVDFKKLQADPWYSWQE